MKKMYPLQLIYLHACYITLFVVSVLSSYVKVGDLSLARDASVVQLQKSVPGWRLKVTRHDTYHITL